MFSHLVNVLLGEWTLGAVLFGYKSVFDLHEKYLDYTPFIPSVSVLSGTWRVGGVLAMSRAFGNRMLKQFVVAEPEIQVDLATLIVVFSSDETVGGAHVLPCSPSGSKSKNFFFFILCNWFGMSYPICQDPWACPQAVTVYCNDFVSIHWHGKPKWGAGQCMCSRDC